MILCCCHSPTSLPHPQIIIPTGTFQPLTSIPLKPIPANTRPRHPVTKPEPTTLHPRRMRRLIRARLINPRFPSRTDSQGTVETSVTCMTRATVRNASGAGTLALSVPVASGGAAAAVDCERVFDRRGGGGRVGEEEEGEEGEEGGEHGVIRYVGRCVGGGERERGRQVWGAVEL